MITQQRPFHRRTLPLEIILNIQTDIRRHGRIDPLVENVRAGSFVGHAIAVEFVAGGFAAAEAGKTGGDGEWAGTI